MRTRRWHVLTVTALVVGLAIPLAAPAGADGPVRSGTVVGSAVVIFLGPVGCDYTPDCRAWRAAGCDPLLAGRDPAVMASIVDVRDLAGTWRSLAIEFPYSSGWLGPIWEFWSADCVQMGQLEEVRSGRQFVVPEGAARLTIPSAGVGAYRWAIY
jgi:hypothetical protein